MPVSQSFQAGMGPILLDNVTCDSELLQCVHPQLTGIHYCDRENVAGVICSGLAITTVTDIPCSTTLFLISTNTRTKKRDPEVDTTSSVIIK